MFLRHTIKAPAPHRSGGQFDEGRVITIQSAQSLLEGEANQKYIDALRERVEMPVKHFDALYLKLIDRFCEFVQVLPCYERREAGGLINDGLLRANAMLERVLESDGDDATFLRGYTFFSCGLLKKVWQAMMALQIDICSETGQHIKTWNPMAETLCEAGEYFRMRYTTGDPPTLSALITPLLAKQIMPDVGMNWISSRRGLLTMWLATLAEDGANSGTLGTNLELAEALIAKQVKALESHEASSMSIPETQVGEAFWKWLKQGIETGGIEVNVEDGAVHLVEGGIWLELDRLAKDFCKVYSECRDWIVVTQQFNMLGLAALSGYDYKHKQYYSKSPEQRAAIANQSKKVVSKHSPLFAKAAGLSGALASSMHANSPQNTHNPSAKSMPGAIVTNPYLVYPRKATPQNAPHMISIDPALMASAALPVVEPEYDYEGPDFTPEPDGSGLAGF